MTGWNRSGQHPALVLLESLSPAHILRSNDHCPRLWRLLASLGADLAPDEALRIRAVLHYLFSGIQRESGNGQRERDRRELQLGPMRKHRLWDRFARYGPIEKAELGTPLVPHW
jgi:hypothetical protein